MNVNRKNKNRFYSCFCFVSCSKTHWFLLKQFQKMWHGEQNKKNCFCFPSFIHSLSRLASFSSWAWASIILRLFFEFFSSLLLHHQTKCNVLAYEREKFSLHIVDKDWMNEKKNVLNEMTIHKELIYVDDNIHINSFFPANCYTAPYLYPFCCSDKNGSEAMGFFSVSYT